MVEPKEGSAPPVRRRSPARFIAGGIIAVITLGALFGLSDVHELWRRSREMSPAWASAAAGIAMLSFCFMTATQLSLLSVLGHRVPIIFMARVSWLSLAVSRILRSGGLSGVFVIAWLLRLRNVPSSVAASMKVGEFFLTNVVFAALFVGSAASLVWPAGAGRAGVPGRLVVLLAGAAGVLGLLILLWRAIVLERRRQVWMNRIVRMTAAGGRLFRRPDWGERARPSIESISRSSRDLLSSPRDVLPAQAWAILRIVCSVGTTWACARAVRIDVDLVTILLAWCLSKLAAVILIVPAGLGVIEASFTAVLVSAGAPYEGALLTALLNRVAYHIVPTAFAVVMGGRLMRDLRSAAGADPAA